jgi:predicted N-acyltransferase
MTVQNLTIRTVDQIAKIPATTWDACFANADSSCQLSTLNTPHNRLIMNDITSKSNVMSEAGEAAESARPIAADAKGAPNPFLAHAFLAALEASGSATRAKGWLPQHLVIEDDTGAIIGLAPAYLKSHSRGEYVFDHAWADAFERAGGRYYPKVQVAVPFTPVTGPRLGVAPGSDPDAVRATLAKGLMALTRQTGSSSAHVTFCTAAEQQALTAQGFLPRIDQQFHFANPGYGSFEDFLGALSSAKRKAIRRERREALAPGITIRRLSGAAITEADWDAFFDFYMDTGGRKWGVPYLTRDFFSRIGAAMAERIVLVMAWRDGRRIAGALNFLGPDCIYGRHWGAIENHAFLHFEVCYYQAIDHAIEQRLPRVEAGAQGEHKLARGYAPVTTHSAHFIDNAGFRRAVADYLDDERRHVAEMGEALAQATPFRKDLNARAAAEEQD